MAVAWVADDGLSGLVLHVGQSLLGSAVSSVGESIIADTRWLVLSDSEDYKVCSLPARCASRQHLHLVDCGRAR